MSRVSWFPEKYIFFKTYVTLPLILIWSVSDFLICSFVSQHSQRACPLPGMTGMGHSCEQESSLITWGQTKGHRQIPVEHEGLPENFPEEATSWPSPSVDGNHPKKSLGRTAGGTRPGGLLRCDRQICRAAACAARAGAGGCWVG